MSFLLPRVFARPVHTPSALLSALSLSSSSSCPSRRGYATETEGSDGWRDYRLADDEYLAKYGEPKPQRIKAMAKPNMYTELVPTHGVSTDWRKISADIDQHFPQPVIGSKPKREIPEPKAPIDTVAAFLSAIGRGVGAKVLAKKADLTWEELFKYNHEKWDACGITMKERKYLLHCVEKYRQGFDPRHYATTPKRPKKYRRHGLAVQDGVRMKWSTKLDIGHARRPWGMKAVVKIKRDD